MPGTRRVVTRKPSATTTQLTSTRSRRFIAGRRSLLLGRRAGGRVGLHLLAKAQRAHVGPDLVDVLEALRLGTLLAHLAPAGRRLAIGEPDGVLLLVVDNHLVGAVVFFVLGHDGLCSSQRRC